MAVPAEHQHQVFAGTAHLPSGRLPLRAAPGRYVGLLTDTMRRPGWRPEIARAQKPPRPSPVSTDRDDHEYTDRAARGKLIITVAHTG